MDHQANAASLSDRPPFLPRSHHRKKCRKLVPLGARFSLGWPCFKLRQLGLDFPKSVCSLYRSLTRSDVNENYDLIAAAPPGPADDSMEENVQLLESYCDKGHMWALLEALRSLRLGQTMESPNWR